MTPEFAAWLERAKAIKLETIIRARNIKLAGREKLAGPCPACGGDDRFAVHLGKQVYHCRGCGASGGGAISFVRWLDGSDFLHAVETITGEPPPVEDRSAGRKRRERVPLGPIIEIYDYTDEAGDLLYQVTRHDPKNFRQRRPDPDNPDGGWISNIDGVRLVPYHLPDLVEAVACGQTVFIVEGEKDANTAERLGLIATCNVMGAGKWKTRGADYAQFFRDADVVIIPDNDEDPRKGRAHANTIAKDLHDVAERVRILTLPSGKDLTVWIEERGGSREALDALVEQAPEYANGYDPNGGGPQPPPQQSQGVVVPLCLDRPHFLEGFVPPDYLIDGIMQRRFLYALTGQTGHAKTAVALVLAELIASQDINAMLGRHRVAKGRVVYFVGENPDDVRMRIIGADTMRGDDPMRDDIFFMPGQFNIAEMRGYLVQQFNHLGGVNLIIVDTSAAYFLGRDEIDNVAMGAHARMLRTLTELPGGPTVLALCHPIKKVESADQLLPRGGGAFIAEIDGNLTLYMSGNDTVELSHTKLRGPGFQPITFKIETISTPKLADKAGRLIPTVRARAMTAAQEQEQELDFTHDREALLVAMLKYPDYSYGQLAEHLRWYQGGRNNEANQAPHKTKVMRAIKYVEEKSRPALIKRNMDKPFLTEEGIKAAQKIEGQMRAREATLSQTQLPL